MASCACMCVCQICKALFFLYISLSLSQCESLRLLKSTTVDWLQVAFFRLSCEGGRLMVQSSAAQSGISPNAFSEPTVRLCGETETLTEFKEQLAMTHSFPTSLGANSLIG